MDIMFSDARLRKTCNQRTRAVRRLGPECATILMRRLDDLRAAEVLADVRNAPGRCHELRDWSRVTAVRILEVVDYHG
jgi:proteic killer suppression protein